MTSPAFISNSIGLWFHHKKLLFCNYILLFVFLSYPCIKKSSLLLCLSTQLSDYLKVSTCELYLCLDAGNWSERKSKVVEKLNNQRSINNQPTQLHKFHLISFAFLQFKHSFKKIVSAYVFFNSLATKQKTVTCRVYFIHSWFEENIYQIVLLVYLSFFDSGMFFGITFLTSDHAKYFPMKTIYFRVIMEFCFTFPIVDNCFKIFSYFQLFYMFNLFLISP